ncbi:hypothetical protein [Adhaeribacter radiodurans]|uniref:DUF5681 domain-containing protein n=1 Tax=Adhaeribacter radiodurans TaxID=2745197 RepID=A0A7L7L5M9_9BACT|nr:hypothetical protein [Adhaeribacter radiodurans]QMU28121.1 hypothetical protein HUW48_08705 [Adhaeribacter radiodurans]
MPLKEGQTNNPNGRPLGSSNKTTKGMRERITAFLDDNFDQIQEDFGKVKPKEKLDFYVKLMQYSLPSLKAIEHNSIVTNKLDNLNDRQLDELIDKILNPEDNEPEP